MRVGHAPAMGSGTGIERAPPVVCTIIGGGSSAGARMGGDGAGDRGMPVVSEGGEGIGEGRASAKGRGAAPALGSDRGMPVAATAACSTAGSGSGTCIRAGARGSPAGVILTTTFRRRHRSAATRHRQNKARAPKTDPMMAAVVDAGKAGGAAATTTMRGKNDAVALPDALEDDIVVADALVLALQLPAPHGRGRAPNLVRGP